MATESHILADSAGTGDSPTAKTVIDKSTVSGIFFNNESATSGDEVQIEAAVDEGGTLDWHPVEGFESITNSDMLSTSETSASLYTSFSPQASVLRVIVTQGTWTVAVE